MTRISLIAAVSRNGVIGDGGALPWRLQGDLKRFKALTIGKPIIMGRKTFESIGRPLPGRRNIVMTRSLEWSADDTSRAGDFGEALRLASAAGPEAVVIGGAEIYAIALPAADRIHLTRVLAMVNGEARFPRLDPSDWSMTASGGVLESRLNDYSCRFFTLNRLVC